MSSKTSKGETEKALGELRRWVADSFNESFMYQRSLDRLQKFASSGEAKLGDVLDALTSLSTWYASVGIVESFAGESSQHLCDSFWCDFLYNTIMRSSFQAQKKDAASGSQARPTISFNDQGLLMAKSFALGLKPEGEAIGRQSLSGLQDGLYYGINGNQLTPFVLSVFAKWKHIALPDDVSSVVPEAYRQVLDSQTSAPEEILPAIVDACDFHLSRSKYHTNSETFEFAGPIYTIYPVEILFVFCIRQILGLENPKVDHPLMNTPLGRLPETGCSVGAELKPIYDRIQSQFPAPA